MFSIKKSYGNCQQCRLIDKPSCILETNAKELEEVEVIFVAENPARTEVEKEIPLIGKAGKIFRSPFDKYIKKIFKYLITNCVLCMTVNSDGTIGNPTDEDVECCSPNLFKLLDLCKNCKLVVVMGTTGMKLFKIGESGITKKAYNFYNWNDKTIYLTCHPSYVARNSSKGGISEKTRYEEGFKEIKEYLESSNKNKEEVLLDIGLDELLYDKNSKENSSATEIDKQKTTIDNSKSAAMFSIPKKYYTKDYRLIDCQYIQSQDRLFYIFRDKNNKKIFYEPPRVTNNYYYYESSGKSKILEPVSNLNLKTCNYRDRKNNQNCYGSDISMDSLSCIDYYLQNECECESSKQNILFIDIEVFTYDDRAFPTAEKSLYPVDLISFALDDGEIQTYLLIIDGEIDPRIHEILETCEYKKNIKTFTNEIEMLKCFAEELKRMGPDFISAWNLSFDLGYLYNRMKRLNLNPKTMSPFDNTFIDTKNGYCLISGFVCIDMYTTYKKLTENEESNYRLDSIAQKELGYGKYQTSVPFFEEYRKEIEEHIKYNRIDVQLIQEINSKVRHIELMEELRKFACTSWKGASSTIGQAEGLFITNLKKKGIYPRNRKDHTEKEKISGAFVKEPEGGIHTWLCDWDFSSLYPNLVRSYNIGPNTYICKVERKIAREIIYEDLLNKDPQKEITVWFDPIHERKEAEIKAEDLKKIIEENKATINISGSIFKGHEIELSIYSDIYNELITARSEYKKLKFSTKDDQEKKVAHNKQWALKILNNSLYGILLNEWFRFYNTDLGLAITMAGQEAVKFAGYHFNMFLEKNEWAVNQKFEEKVMARNTKYLLYMDTDSIFIKIGEYIKNNKEKIKKKHAKFFNNDNDTIMTSDLILKIVSDLDPILNKDILGHFIKIHNISKEHSKLEMKQEIISDRAYFLNAKKRYATHIINREGYETNEIDIKGIETERSDYSQFTKEVLKKILDMILLENDVGVDEILDYVDKMKMKSKELALKGDISVARPASWAKPLNEYKTIPDNVRGMMFWNKIVFDIFRNGSKGYKFNILGIDIEKAPEFVVQNIEKNKDILTENVVVVPGELDKLPEFFVPDIQKISSFAVDDRIDLLLEPLISKDSDLLTFE